MLVTHEKVRMNIEVITSFNQRYYDLIGKDSVESWLKYWPIDMKLTCYVEEFYLPKQERIKQISFDTFNAEYTTFQSSVSKQVQKFAKKAFSFIHAMEHSTADRIVWLDADVITQDTLPRELLESLLPNDVLCTHMGVTYTESKDGTPGRWFVPETGFFAVNTRHAKFHDFKNEYKRLYVEKDHAHLRRFYDNDVYGDAFEKMKAPGLDLCEGLEKGYKTPLRHTVLGPFLHHYKAKHSKAGYVND